MTSTHNLKQINNITAGSDQPHRILSEMGLPAGTEFCTDDSEGMVTISVGKIKNEYTD